MRWSHAPTDRRVSGEHTLDELGQATGRFQGRLYIIEQVHIPLKSCNFLSATIIAASCARGNMRQGPGSVNPATALGCARYRAEIPAGAACILANTIPVMAYTEQALVFDCEGESLIGVLSGAALTAERGVLIIVGGPQYRVGSHRQFTLLARHLAEHGIPALRFDYRGMGDSDGEMRTFERVGADIRCAIDRFFASAPGLKDVVLWGLCDAASAVLLYAHQDARVSGLVLLNPWVRTEQGAARVHLRHYYWQRLFQASLWQKVARGEFRFREAAAALGKFALDAMGPGPSSGSRVEGSPASASSLPDRMEAALRGFQGSLLLILSGNDLVAQEFNDLAKRSRNWRRMLEDRRVTRHDLPEANHTFARRDWRNQVERWTEAWVKDL